MIGTVKICQTVLCLLTSLSDSSNLALALYRKQTCNKSILALQMDNINQHLWTVSRSSNSLQVIFIERNETMQLLCAKIIHKNKMTTLYLQHTSSVMVYNVTAWSYISWEIQTYYMNQPFSSCMYENMDRVTSIMAALQRTPSLIQNRKLFFNCITVLKPATLWRAYSCMVMYPPYLCEYRYIV